MKGPGLLTALAIVGMGWAPKAAATVQTPSSAPIRVVLVGDSTVTEGSGWGLGFSELATPRVVVINAAANGRSSKSYIDEGRWKAALAEHGDYYLIQFGHNDEPGKGADRETDPSTTFSENLRKYVTEARAAGATPILVTSLVRRTFDQQTGRIRSSQRPYVDATRDVAKREKVPLVDLFARSLELSERMGAHALEPYSARQDNGSIDTTHLNPAGSRLFAKLVVQELRRAAPKLGELFRLEAATHQ